MKKLDIIAIAFVVIVGVTTFLLYFDKFRVDTSNSQLEIYFKSIMLDDPIFLTENTDITYHIESVDNRKRLQVERIDHKKNTTTVYFVDEPQTLEVHHTIEVTYDRIRITEASCEGKDCMRGYMSHENTIPIVCINGISVRFNKLEIISGGPR